VRRAALAVAVVALAGCDEKERATRSEAAGVSRAVDAVRSAENAQKSAPLDALRRTPCSAPEVCAVQSYCVAAYEKHVAALGLVDEAKATVATAPAEKVAATLTAAETALGQAKTMTDECATRQGELVRKFRVGR
jgi:hypothetical protein